jgi:4-oxalocrotonate tautomerase
MPIVQISIVEGRKPEQIRELIREVTVAVAGTLSAPIDSVKVIVTEVRSSHWGSGEQTIEEKKAQTA